MEKKMSDTAQWLVSQGAQILRASRASARTVAQVLLFNRCLIYADQVMYDDGDYDVVFYFLREGDVKNILSREDRREDMRATLAAPNAAAWANAFVAHKKAMDWPADIIDEPLMTHWFASFAMGGPPPDINDRAQRCWVGHGRADEEGKDENRKG